MESVSTHSTAGSISASAMDVMCMLHPINCYQAHISGHYAMGKLSIQMKEVQTETVWCDSHRYSMPLMFVLFISLAV